MNGPEPARILIVDDNRAIHEDYRKILAFSESDSALTDLERKWYGEAGGPRAAALEFRVDSAYDGQEALRLVEQASAEQFPYCVAFVDMRMPRGWDGPQTVQCLWAADPRLQVVICSSNSDYNWKEITERLGQSHRLLLLKKPFEPIEALQFAHALTRKWRNERALREQLDSLERVVTASTQGLEAANRQLRHMATHDALTALPNRLLLDDRVNQAITQAETASERFALAVLDLDRFKLINDSFGHRSGDELLREIARRLTGSVRSVDTVARLGGDEFVLIIREIGAPEEAKRVAKKILKVLQLPVRMGEIDVHPSASIGMAFFPWHGTTAEALFARAHTAMYVAKQRGRKTVQCFAPDMDTLTQERIRLESDLYEALKNEQFELYYQPKIDAASGRYRGAEALLRWQHPERGTVGPDSFIPLAEESGLIVPIGEWVIREACRQIRAWGVAGLPFMRIAVNVSATQFQHRDLIDVVERALDDAGVEASLLEIELTESAVMSNAEESAAILQQLSRRGVVVSVDDFGTGYSSMSCLHRFPLDKLKIDRSFIHDVTSSSEAAAVVQGIICLAHSLRLKVIAEGVETLEQLQFLKSYGCDQLQGFYISPPLPASAFEELLLAQMASDAEEDETVRTHSKLAGISSV
ncbi:MAG: EAL domain-containing protein [Sinobacteraceae bacterium]|nr:EAL domain-containing protein [Nevskiaceae bacterium]